MSEAPKDFRFLGGLREVSVIAAGSGVMQASVLRRRFGGGRWRKMKGIAAIERDNGYIGDAEIHWFEAHGVGKVGWKVKRELRRQRYPFFVLCIDASGYEVSLIEGKVYQVIRPEVNDRPADYRVIDEEGEDYLYDARRFVKIEVPANAKRVILSRHAGRLV